MITMADSARGRLLAMVLVLLVGVAVIGYRRAASSAPDARARTSASKLGGELSADQRLQAAREAVAEVASVTFAYSSDTRTPEDMLHFSGSTVMDLDAGRSRTSVTMPGNALVQKVFPGQAIEQVIDGSTLYLRTPPALRGASGGHDWFSIPRRNTADALGGEALTSDIRGLLDLAVKTARTVTDRGLDVDRGGRHLAAVLDVAEMAELNGRTPPPADAPDTLQLDLYLNPANLPVEITMRLHDEGGNGVVLTGVFSGYGAPVDVPRIDPSDAFPVADQREAFQLLARAAGFAPAR